MFGPLGISLAPQIKQNRTLYKFLAPIAKAYVKAVGHRRMGLKYDDLLVEERDDVQKALSRMPARESYDRAFRLKRLMQLSLQHVELPKDQWTRAEDDKRYLVPLVREVEAADAERKEWDTMEVKIERK